MRGKKVILTDGQRTWLVDNYADVSNAELAKHLNVGWRTVVRMARRLGLEKSQTFMEKSWRKGVETMRILNKEEGNRGKNNIIIHGAKFRFKKGENYKDRCSAEEWTEIHRRAKATRNAIIKRERVRINWGYEQKTRLRLVRNDRQTYMRYALKKRGYLVTRGAIDVYYNEQTRRSPLIERHALEIGIRVYQMHNS